MSEVLEHGTMEDFILKLLKIKGKELSEMKDTESHIYHRKAAQIDILYIVLTGWNNPQSNPKT